MWRGLLVSAASAIASVIMNAHVVDELPSVKPNWSLLCFCARSVFVWSSCSFSTTIPSRGVTVIHLWPSGSCNGFPFLCAGVTTPGFSMEGVSCRLKESLTSLVKGCMMEVEAYWRCSAVQVSCLAFLQLLHMFFYSGFCDLHSVSLILQHHEVEFEFCSLEIFAVVVWHVSWGG